MDSSSSNLFASNRPGSLRLGYGLPQTLLYEWPSYSLNCRTIISRMSSIKADSLTTMNSPSINGDSRPSFHSKGGRGVSQTRTSSPEYDRQECFLFRGGGHGYIGRRVGVVRGLCSYHLQLGRITTRRCDFRTRTTVVETGGNSKYGHGMDLYPPRRYQLTFTFPAGNIYKNLPPVPTQVLVRYRGVVPVSLSFHSIMT